MIQKYKYIILIVIVILTIGFGICKCMSIYNKNNYFKVDTTPDEIITSQHFPPIKRFRHILSKKECTEIIKYAKSKLKRSTLGVDAKIGSRSTSTQVWIDPNELPSLKRISILVSKISGLPIENQEDFQFLNYKVGQQYKAHWDSCTKILDEYDKCIEENKKRGWGQRVYTFFIYLNDVEEGGETYFPKLDIKIKPERGSAIFWDNLTTDRKKTNEYALHAGLPPIKGNKYSINVWVRENAKKK